VATQLHSATQPISTIGKTNGAGDFLNSAYNSDGTIASTTDAGGTITFGQDANGYVNNITYPNSLGSESFVKNTFDDVTAIPTRSVSLRPINSIIVANLRIASRRQIYGASGI